MFKNKLNLLILILFCISCEKTTNNLIGNSGETVFYEVTFKNKDNIEKTYRQSYHFLPMHKNFLPAVKNDGEIILFSKNKKGIQKNSISNVNFTDYEDLKDNVNSNLILAFPLLEGTEWITKDITTIKLVLGFDRIYNTNLPFELTNKIVKTNETISINGRKIRNCIKVSSYGKTSFLPGPPLDKINIEIISNTWFAKDLGLIKYEREEKSDSATTGNIIYKKKMLIN